MADVLCLRTTVYVPDDEPFDTALTDAVMNDIYNPKDRRIINHIYKNLIETLIEDEIIEDNRKSKANVKALLKDRDNIEKYISIDIDNIEVECGYDDQPEDSSCYSVGFSFDADMFIDDFYDEAN